MDRSVTIACCFALFMGCARNQPQQNGRVDDMHWLKLGSLFCEFPSTYEIYWPDTVLEGVSGYVVRGDTCFFEFAGDGAIGLESIAGQLANARFNGAVDTLECGEFVVIYNWHEQEGLFAFEGNVVPIDTAAHRLFSIRNGWYWLLGRVSSCPGSHISRS